MRIERERKQQNLLSILFLVTWNKGMIKQMPSVSFKETPNMTMLWSEVNQFDRGLCCAFLHPATLFYDFPHLNGTLNSMKQIGTLPSSFLVHGTKPILYLFYIIRMSFVFPLCVRRFLFFCLMNSKCIFLLPKITI